MREILFKGKTLLGKWIEGDLIQYLGCGKMHIAQNYKGAGGQEVIPETVGQYTGLTDKNGKKIFEGDIIIESDGGMDGIPRKVVWDEEWMQFECPLVRRHWAYGTNCGRLWLMRDRDIEIIGNIHDNPELLKEGERDG